MGRIDCVVVLVVCVFWLYQVESVAYSFLRVLMLEVTYFEVVCYPATVCGVAQKGASTCILFYIFDLII